MKQDPLAEYRKLLGQVYGPSRATAVGPTRATSSRVAVSVSRVVSKSFDDGRAVRLPGGWSAAAGVDDPDEVGTEYDVASGNPSFVAARYEDAEATKMETPQGDMPSERAPAPEPSPTPDLAEPEAASFSNEPIVVVSSAAGEHRAPARSSFTERRMKELVTDNELLSDIQSILHGNEATRAEDPPRSAPQSNTTRAPAIPQAPTPAPPEPSAELAIFDRIARNMQYATAYELGSIELARKFDAFDGESQKSLPIARPQDPAAR